MVSPSDVTGIYIAPESNPVLKSRNDKSSGFQNFYFYPDRASWSIRLIEHYSNPYECTSWHILMFECSWLSDGCVKSIFALWIRRKDRKNALFFLSLRSHLHLSHLDTRALSGSIVGWIWNVSPESSLLSSQRECHHIDVCSSTITGAIHSF